MQPTASLQHRAAFSNSVSYLVSGCAGGFGGPSMREHLCSYSLAGSDGANEGGIQYPDGSLPRPGEWGFEEAIAHCNPLCFGDANQYRMLLLQILEQEHCFDDDPADLEVVRGKVCEVCGKLLAKQARGHYCKLHRHLDPDRKAKVREANRRHKQIT